MKNLSELFKITTRRYRWLSVLFASLCVTVSMAQTSRISGTVVDQGHEPIIGVTVTESGTQNAAVTDLSGRFNINVHQGSRLTFSYVGFKTISAKAANGMQIIMQEESNMLSEVVTIGYGSVKRRDVTTAVSTVSTKDLDTRPIVSAVTAMQGKAAGLLVSQANGKPGSTPTIRVRGTTSLNGSNSPLYVVDGVPLTDIEFLSPADIDNIQVLKDASSAAIYGSRAANGVIIITTKQGRKGMAKVSLNAHCAFNKARDNRMPLNARQYKDLMDDIGIVKLPDNLTDQTNWADEIYRTGTMQDYQLSVTNGNDKLRYYLSGGFTGEKGILKMSDFKRYNFRASIENDIRSWLRVNANVAYSDYISRGTDIISGQGANRGGVITAVINTPTYAPVWDSEHPGQFYNNFFGANVSSPIESLSRTKGNNNHQNRLIATGKATINFMPELNFVSSVTFDRTQGHVYNFLDPHETQYGRDTHGNGYDARSIHSVWIIDNVLSFKKSINNHGFDVMAGSSYTKSEWSQNHIEGDHYANNLVKTLNAANHIGINGAGSDASDWAIMSYFGRLQYNFEDTYMLTANVRADGSSKLAPGHRWGCFPSFSAAWRLSNENFIKKISWIDDLKIRGGWGQTGNQSGVGDYGYLARYGFSRLDWTKTENVNAVPVVVQRSLSSPELTWEATTQTNVGFDLTVLKNRLTVYADYYYKKTTDMLMRIALPAGSAPVSELIYNGGTMVNKGLELSVNSKNFVGEFKWDTDFNISFNRNELKSLKLTQVYNTAKTIEHVDDYVVRNTPGRPLGSFYGYIAKGVDKETGDMIYEDVNKDGKINSSDRTYIGDPNPDFIFGLTNSFQWKGFSLSILLQGSVGNDVYNVARMETEGMYDAKNQSTKVLRRWRKPGQTTDVPRAKWNIKNSTYFVEDGSYVRLRDISLAYELPKSLIRHMGITRLQPYVSATNLITITRYSGMDPEANQYGNSGAVQGMDWGSYPMCRSFVVGLRAEF